MLGNDIIDLKAVRPRSLLHWQRYRAKTMTTSEQTLLAAYRVHQLDIWIAWAVKESVYKLEFQLVQQRYFAPKQIQLITFNANDFKGQVQGRFGIYNYELLLKEGFLHALAWDKSSKKPSFHCLALADCSLDDYLMAIIRKKFPDSYLQYQRAPFPVFILDKKITIPISKSHHGRWQAFAY